MYDYGYTTYDMVNSIDMADSAAVGSVFGILAGMSMVMWVISLAIGIFSIITMCGKFLLKLENQVGRLLYQYIT